MGYPHKQENDLLMATAAVILIALAICLLAILQLSHIERPVVEKDSNNENISVCRQNFC